MTGSHTLDIIITLVFVYLLYSLLASIVGEMVNSFLGLRARNLKFAIDRMLRDEWKQGNADWKVLFNLRLVSWVWMFVSDILALFYHKTGAFTKKFYENPSIKYLAKDKSQSSPSYIDPGVFSQTLVDILKEGMPGDTDLERIQHRLGVIEIDPSWEVKPEQQKRLMEIVKADELDAVSLRYWIDQFDEANTSQALDTKDKNAKPLLEPETKAHFKSLLEHAQNDLDEFQDNIELWYNHTMDRCAGWYKRKSGVIMLILGFLIAYNFNVDTIQMVQKMKADEEMTRTIVDNIKKHHETTLEGGNADLEKVADEEIQTMLSEINLDLALGWNPETEAYYCKNPWRSFLGWLITALAISLGAPFWFDLLNKFMRLRSSMPKPVGNTTKKGGGGAGTQEKAEA